MTKHNRWRSVYMQSMRHVLKSNRDNTARGHIIHAGRIPSGAKAVREFRGTPGRSQTDDKEKHPEDPKGVGVPLLPAFQWSRFDSPLSSWNAVGG